MTIQHYIIKKSKKNKERKTALNYKKQKYPTLEKI
jgi:hypothetical protein